MKKKLCIVYNIAAKYWEGIFGLIDQEYDCDWYFGTNNTDIKGMYLSRLRSVNEVVNVHWRGMFIWQSRIVSLAFKRQYPVYLMLGDPNTLSTWIAALIIKLFFPEKRVYFWSHGWYGKENSLRRLLKKLFFHMVDGTFLYGNYAKQLMVENGFKPERLHVIHNSLAYEKQLSIREKIHLKDIYKEHFGNDLPNLIFIGRLTKVKRLDLLIDALAVLKNQKFKVNLTLVGEGVQRQMLEEKVNCLRLLENVWFYGANYDEVSNAELIYNADLCVSPGNVGLTAIHTMMFGTPVLTHNCFKYQMPEFEAIIDGKTGAFFEYNNVEAIAQAIKQWIDCYQFCREAVREACFKEIDSVWTPQFQIDVIKNVINQI